MSTGDMALAALFLCLAAGEASGNAVSILTSRLVRHPEVPCALDLIPPLFQRADNDSAALAPLLLVVGNADWLSEFLRRLPSVASIFVFTDETTTSKFEDFLLAGMMPSASILLHVTDFADSVGSSITVPKRVRYTYWVSHVSDASADYVISHNLSPPDLCFTFFRLMITARPRGTTHVLSVPMPCDMASWSSPPKSELLGVWSRGAGWSAPHVPVFPPLCASWRPPPDGKPLLAEMFDYAIGTTSVDTYKGTETYEVLRLLRDSYGLGFQMTANVTTKALVPYRRADTCRLDVLALPTSPDVVDAQTHAELSVYPWDYADFICVVPTGAGKPRSVLYPITAEYTPAVWAALVAVVLAVVACLYLMRCDESVQELFFQTLSPLLGQLLDDRRPGPQIAVLGGWLLTCVVLIGAYQGQLLGFITFPSKNGEINSWQDWLESDLVLVVANKYITASSADDFGLYGLTEERIVRTTSGTRALFQVAIQRNTSCLITEREFERVRDTVAELREEYYGLFLNLHSFVVPTIPRPYSSFVTMIGSPFEVPLRNILGRIHAAGGLRQNRKYEKYFPQDTEDRPISLLNIKPIIVAYSVGNTFAVFTFLLEFSLPALRKFCWLTGVKIKTNIKPPRPYLP
ncbi:Ionotropic receptor 259 [Frankliniella occidentalis]|nr:Ionotropic receptor 259 [Frankliniella occidentalis]